MSALFASKVQTRNRVPPSHAQASAVRTPCSFPRENCRVDHRVGRAGCCARRAGGVYLIDAGERREHPSAEEGAFWNVVRVDRLGVEPGFVLLLPAICVYQHMYATRFDTYARFNDRECISPVLRPFILDDNLLHLIPGDVEVFTVVPHPLCKESEMRVWTALNERGAGRGMGRQHKWRKRNLPIASQSAGT